MWYAETMKNKFLNIFTKFALIKQVYFVEIQNTINMVILKQNKLVFQLYFLYKVYQNQSNRLKHVKSAILPDWSNISFF